MYRKPINNKSEWISVRLSKSEREALESYANSTNDMISKIVRSALRSQGII